MPLQRTKIARFPALCLVRGIAMASAVVVAGASALVSPALAESPTANGGGPEAQHRSHAPARAGVRLGISYRTQRAYIGYEHHGYSAPAFLGSGRIATRTINAPYEHFVDGGSVVGPRPEGAYHDGAVTMVSHPPIALPHGRHGRRGEGRRAER